MSPSTIQNFLKTRNQLGHVNEALFDATYSAFADGEEQDMFQFSLISINLPSIRANTSQIFFDGMPIEVFTTFQYDMDFSMTVLCDNAGEIYRKFIEIIKSKGEENDYDEEGKPSGEYSENYSFNNIVDTEQKITLTAKPDYAKETMFRLGIGVSRAQSMKIILYGVRLKSIGNLNFSNTSNEVANFSVGGSIINFSVNADSTAREEGVTIMPDKKETEVIASIMKPIANKTNDNKNINGVPDEANMEAQIKAEEKAEEESYYRQEELAWNEQYKREQTAMSTAENDEGTGNKTEDASSISTSAGKKADSSKATSSNRASKGNRRVFGGK